MATNEGLKPVSGDQVPVDPNVRIPDHVRRAAEAAEAFYRPAEGGEPQPDPAAQAAAGEQQPAPAAQAAAQEAERAAQAAAAAAQPAAGEQPLPRDESISAEEWHHRFLSMQGRYNKATLTIGSMEQQMTELGQELVRVQNILAQQNQQPAPRERSQVNHNNLITEADRENYGDELLDLARRVAITSVAPELDQLRADNQHLTNQVKNTAKRELFMSLDRQLPQWRQINTDIRFKSWLRLPNIYTGSLRSEMLKGAVDGANAPQVLQLFRDFLMEAQATGQMAPAPTTEQQTQKPAPRVPAVALETLAAPGRARPASGDSQVPTEKPVYSRADISKFYSDSRKGLYAGREAEYNATQADLTLAQTEGRIRG